MGEKAAVFDQLGRILGEGMLGIIQGNVQEKEQNSNGVDWFANLNLYLHGADIMREEYSFSQWWLFSLLMSWLFIVLMEWREKK